MRNIIKRIALSGIVIAVLLSSGCTASDPATPTTVLNPDYLTQEKKVTLSALPTTLPADGLTSTLVTATCTIGGNPAPDGMYVNFRTTFGNFSQNGLDKLKSPEDHVITRTTKNGKATIYMIAYYKPRTTTVTALFANVAWDQMDFTYE